jgi:hypothetical protein
MKIIECPDKYYPKESDISIFVAGGISGCFNWQQEMIARFKDHDDNLVMINPRRADYDMSDPELGAKQIEWERAHLIRASAVLFWFPYETLCPITLFELGAMASSGKKIFVACHPAYQRKFDVEKQISLIRPDVTVHDKFCDMVDDIDVWIESNK